MKKMMKKIYTLLAMLLFVSFTFAQVNQITQIEEANGPLLQKVNSTNNSKTPTDTILMGDFLTNTPSAGGINGMYGWMFGTSWWGVDTVASNACAQGYIVYSGAYYNIEEVLIWAHSKYKYSANGSSLMVTVNALDDSSHYGNSTTDWDIVCPGTVLGNGSASTAVPFNSIDTGFSLAFTTATFTSPVYISQDYAVVVDVADFYLNDDTVGFVAGASGSATNIMGLEYTWWKYNNPSSGEFWAQLSHIFTSAGVPTDRAIAFWPVVQSDGISENTFINGLKIRQNYPNPAQNSTIIEYEVDKNANVTLFIIDQTGKTVFESNEGFRTTGTKYSITVNTKNLASGTYYYSMTADGQRLTKKMIITK